MCSRGRSSDLSCKMTDLRAQARGLNDAKLISEERLADLCTFLDTLAIHSSVSDQTIKGMIDLLQDEHLSVNEAFMRHSMESLRLAQAEAAKAQGEAAKAHADKAYLSAVIDISYGRLACDAAGYQALQGHCAAINGTRSVVSDLEFARLCPARISEFAPPPATMPDDVSDVSSVTSASVSGSSVRLKTRPITKFRSEHLDTPFQESELVFDEEEIIRVLGNHDIGIETVNALCGEYDSIRSAYLRMLRFIRGEEATDGTPETGVADRDAAGSVSEVRSVQPALRLFLARCLHLCGSVAVVKKGDELPISADVNTTNGWRYYNGLCDGFVGLLNQQGRLDLLGLMTLLEVKGLERFTHLSIDDVRCQLMLYLIGIFQAQRSMSGTNSCV